jgi:hypothetical protein
MVIEGCKIRCPMVVGEFSPFLFDCLYVSRLMTGGEGDESWILVPSKNGDELELPFFSPIHRHLEHTFGVDCLKFV